MTGGAGSVVGYVLPLAPTDGGWMTERWQLRRSALFLLPGDSPVGLRLPLGSLGPGIVPPLWADAPDLPDPAPDAERVLIAAGERHALLDCLAELETRQRDAIRTAFFDGVTYAAIAARAASMVAITETTSWCGCTGDSTRPSAT